MGVSHVVAHLMISDRLLINLLRKNYVFLPTYFDNGNSAFQRHYLQQA